MVRNSITILISKVKGEQFTLDPKIPLSYFIEILFSRLIMMIRGLLIFKKKYIFIGRNSTIKCKSKLHIGKNVKIANNCYIDALSTDGIEIGNNVNIGKYCSIEATGTVTNIGKGLVIEDGVGLNSNCFLGCAGGIRIGQDTIIGELVTMHSENHNFSDISKPIKHQGTNRTGIVIGSGCWIGAKVTVLDGAEIGNGCVIGAGSVVTAGKYNDNCIYGGVPAKLLKSRVENLKNA